MEEPIKLVAMAKILDDVCGYSWGFYSREDLRMHIQAMNPQTKKEYGYKIWLEQKGIRIFEPAVPKIPEKILIDLKTALDVDGERTTVELAWTRMMIQKKWITVHIDEQANSAQVIAYPNTGISFLRIVDLNDHTVMPEHYKPDNWRLDWGTYSLILNTKYPKMETHIDLLELLWQDSSEATNLRAARNRRLASKDSLMTKI